MCRARDPNFQPWISVPEHVIFTNFPKIRFGASPFYILGADFAVPGPLFSKFLSFQSERKALGSAAAVSSRPERQLDAVLAVPETSIFTLKTAEARSGAPRKFMLKTAQPCSGDPLFHARLGARPELLPIFYFAAAHT